MLFGCSKKEEIKLSEPINLVCKGQKYTEGESSNWTKQTHQYPITTTYVIFNTKSLDGKSFEWSINEDGTINLTLLNYDYPDQDGHPKVSTSLIVNDQLIDYTSYSWTKIDKKSDSEKNYSNRLRINRLSGEWYSDRTDNTKWNDGSWMKDHQLSTGKCEKVQQKF
jgi:hypothetical protein